MKRIIVEEARRRGVPVTMINDPSHALREDYATVVTVDKGRDSVDFKMCIRDRSCGGRHRERHPRAGGPGG